jgi:hypothetical protein
MGRSSPCEIESMSDDRLMLTILIACIIIAAGVSVKLFLLTGDHGFGRLGAFLSWLDEFTRRRGGAQSGRAIRCAALNSAAVRVTADIRTTPAGPEIRRI